MDVYQTPFGVPEALFDGDRGFLLTCEHPSGTQCACTTTAVRWTPRFQSASESAR